MQIGLAGYDSWINACREILDTGAEHVLLKPDHDPPDGLPLAISGSSGEWYPLVDAALRRGSSVLLGNPGAWSFHDLKALQALADEAGVEMWTYRPWRWTLPLAHSGGRLVKVAVTVAADEKWKPWFGHAVDRALGVLGTDSLLRADATRGLNADGDLSLLLVHARFQNGAAAQISLEKGATSGVRLTTPVEQKSSSDSENRETLNATIQAFLTDPDVLPTLNEAIAGRKIEEKVFSILRTG